MIRQGVFRPSQHCARPRGLGEAETVHQSRLKVRPHRGRDGPGASSRRESVMFRTSTAKRQRGARAADAGVAGEATGTSHAPGFSRRHFFGAAAAAVAAGQLGLFGLDGRLNAMTATIAEVEAEQQAGAVQTGGDPTDLRPFRVNVPEAELTDLRRRVKATKWPERETVADDSQGVRLATSQALARYWATDYDWRKVEVRLNAVPQFITNIDGLDIHFIHVRSKHENALPMIVTHGWPGSVIEQLKIIEPLANPTAHGGSASDAFDLV